MGQELREVVGQEGRIVFKQIGDVIHCSALITKPHINLPIYPIVSVPRPCTLGYASRHHPDPAKGSFEYF